MKATAFRNSRNIYQKKPPNEQRGQAKKGNKKMALSQFYLSLTKKKPQ